MFCHVLQCSICDTMLCNFPYFFCHDLGYLVSVLYSGCKLGVECMELEICLKWMMFMI